MLLNQQKTQTDHVSLNMINRQPNACNLYCFTNVNSHYIKFNLERVHVYFTMGYLDLNLILHKA